MPEAYVEYTGDGSVNDFTVTFGYLKKSHVKVYLDGVEDQTFTWIDATSIAATTTPASGVTVLISRTTPRDALVYEIPDSGTYKGADLNNQALQALYIAAEGYDALENTIALDTGDNTWDADTKRIKNIVDPVDAQDVATKNYTLTGDDSQLAAAAASATAAAASESAAATSESTASTAATTATTQAGLASTSASNASTSASTATTQATNAANDASYAEEWANKAEDSLVSAAAGGDEVDDYSALHFANKAAASAAAADADATTTAALVADLANPERPNNAVELLRGNNGVALHMLARDYVINDYESVLDAGPARLLHNAPFTMNTDTSLTVTNSQGGSETLSANEMTYDHEVSGNIVTKKGLYFAGGSHTMTEATLGSTIPIDMDNMTIFVEFMMDNTTGTQVVLEFYTTAPTTDGYFLHVVSGGLDWEWHDGTVQQASVASGTTTADTVTRSIAVFRSDGMLRTLSTGQTAVNASSSGLTFPATATDLRLGNSLSGHIRKMAIITRAMPDSEMATWVGVSLA